MNTSSRLVDWIPVEQEIPKSGMTVLAFYRNTTGDNRIICASWIEAKSQESDPDDEWIEYDDATDTFYKPKGWYEQIDNWDDYSSVYVYEGIVSHWMHMPLPPT